MPLMSQPKICCKAKYLNKKLTKWRMVDGQRPSIVRLLRDKIGLRHCENGIICVAVTANVNVMRKS